MVGLIIVKNIRRCHIMEAEGNIINRYIYSGEEGEVIPDNATHVFVVAKIILRSAFLHHPNIVEMVCHKNVEKIERAAFSGCPRLRRVIMPGVKIVEKEAFYCCGALTDADCDKLEIIKEGAFCGCTSLSSINLQSARIVKEGAFCDCPALTDAEFGNELERIDESAFGRCISLERITIPLKNGLITHDNTFQGCEKLKHVDLVEGEWGLQGTVAALHLGAWRNDMYKEMNSINQNLPTADAGCYDDDVDGEKAIAIRAWISSLLDKITDYKAEHRRLLEEDVAPTLKRFVPQDIVMNSVLLFLNLPPNSFDVA